MSWIRLDDNMLDHPKWRRAIREGGDGALTVWVRLISWCSRNLTDGVVPADMVPTLASVRSESRSRALRALADSGLTSRSPSGDLIINDYLERNPSRQEVLTERSRRTDSQRKRRSSELEAGLHETSEAECNSVPARPGPAQSHERDPERARAEPPVSDLERVAGGGVARTYTMPSEHPPKDYLDEAVMRAVPQAQAVSTWEHYRGAGLPERGVERLYEWLLKRANERLNATVRLPTRRGAKPKQDLDDVFRSEDIV